MKMIKLYSQIKDRDRAYKAHWFNIDCIDVADLKDSPRGSCGVLGYVSLSIEWKDSDTMENYSMDTEDYERFIRFIQIE